MRARWILRRALVLALAPALIAAEFVDEPDAPSAFTTRIRARDFDDRFESVEDVLNHAVGIRVRRFGALGTHSTASIRGSRAEQVLVLLDGVRLNSTARGEVDLSTLPLRTVETIDVLRGAGSARYGTDAIGGVISIRSRRADAESGADASFTVGRYDTLGTDLHVSLVGDRLQGSLAYSRLRSQNDFEFDADARATQFRFRGRRSNAEFEPETTRLNAGFVEDTGLLDLSLDAGPTTRLGATLRLFRRDNGQPGSTIGRAIREATDETRNALKADEEQRRALVSLRLEEARESWGLGATLYHRYDRYKLDDHGDPDWNFVDQGFVGSNELVYTDQQSGLDVSFVPRARELSWATFANRSAASLRRDQVSSDIGSTRDRWIANLFVQEEIALFGRALRLFPAIGYEVASTGSGELKLIQAAAPAPVEVDDAVDRGVWLPRIGLIARLGPGLRLKSNYLKAYRRPNFNELFRPDLDLARGNPNLRPEESWNFDVGFEYARDRAGPFSAVRVEGSWFHRDLDQAIEWVLVNEVFAPVNTGEATTRGVEASVALTLFERLDLGANYTWVDSEITATGTPLPHTPEHSGFARAGLRLPGAQLWGELSYDDVSYRDPTGVVLVPAVKQIDAGISLWPHELPGLRWVPEGLGLSFEADNLTREQRVDSQGLPLPRQTLWYARVRVRLR